MKTVFEDMKNEGGGRFSVEGAMDNIEKSRRNIILHAPTPRFIEYLRSDLLRETKRIVEQK